MMTIGLPDAVDGFVALPIDGCTVFGVELRIGEKAILSVCDWSEGDIAKDCELQLNRVIDGSFRHEGDSALGSIVSHSAFKKSNYLARSLERRQSVIHDGARFYHYEVQLEHGTLMVVAENFAYAVLRKDPIIRPKN